jgi:hypothetical protein
VSEKALVLSGKNQFIGKGDATQDDGEFNKQRAEFFEALGHR